MTRSALQSVKPTATYNLAEVYKAVVEDKTRYEAEVIGRADWAKNWPPQATIDALAPVVDQLHAWISEGVTEIVAEAPFADGSLTGPVEDTIIEQFRKDRVLPKPR